MMSHGEFEKLLNTSSESQEIEFKEAKETFSVLGGNSQRKSVYGYCSGIGNRGGGKLILGVTNSIPRNVVGTKAIPNIAKAQSQLFDMLGMRVDIEELIYNGKRVVVVNIPPREIGKVIKFYGTSLTRVGESLKEMGTEELAEILLETRPDWTASIIEEASISDLSEEAIKLARENYKVKNPKRIQEVDTWDNTELLNKMKVLNKGAITVAAIILLGKSESTHFISPKVSRITWVLKDVNGKEKDYEHFDPPFLLAIDNVRSKIRNLTYRYTSGSSIFPEEAETYDDGLIREALNNCIAHQDYQLQGKITVVEYENGKLVFSNRGSFLPGTIDKVINSNAPFDIYRNKFLAEAMVNLNMIDTIGSGIKRMFYIQSDKLFPLPSYDLANETVELEILGKVLDMQYAALLTRDKSLTLNEIFLLDKVQKKQQLTKEQASQLRDRGFVEGRYPNLFISRMLSEKTGRKFEYTDNSALNEEYYKNLILKHIEDFPHVSKDSIKKLIIPKLSQNLNESQKINKLNNIMSSLRAEKKIKNKGSRRVPEWVLYSGI